MTAENILYVCIDCGILPSISRIYFPDEIHAAYECPNCFQYLSTSMYSDELTVGTYLPQFIKEKWNNVNHPDLLKEMINPCKEHPFGIAYNPPDIRKFFEGAAYSYRVVCGGYHQLPREYFSTPKEAIEKWNAENPKEEKC